MFWRVEGKSGLYVFFKTVCDLYNLIPEDNYTIPPEAEGIESVEGSISDDHSPPGVLLKRGVDDLSSTFGPPSTVHAGATARRQRHRHSRASSVVTTVLEENEENEDDGGDEVEDEDEDENETHDSEVSDTQSEDTVIHEGKYQGANTASSESTTSEVEAFPEVDPYYPSADEGDDYTLHEIPASSSATLHANADSEPFPDVDAPAADATAATTSVND